MIDRRNLLIVERQFVDSLLVVLSEGYSQATDDGGFIFRDGPDVWMQAEDGRIFFGNGLYYIFLGLGVYPTEIDGLDGLVILSVIENIGTYKQFYQQTHFDPI